MPHMRVLGRMRALKRSQRMGIPSFLWFMRAINWGWCMLLVPMPERLMIGTATPYPPFQQLKGCDLANHGMPLSVRALATHSLPFSGLAIGLGAWGCLSPSAEPRLRDSMGAMHECACVWRVHDF